MLVQYIGSRATNSFVVDEFYRDGDGTCWRRQRRAYPVGDNRGDCVVFRVKHLPDADAYTDTKGAGDFFRLPLMTNAYGQRWAPIREPFSAGK
jgi:hypothetical protein